MGSRSVLFISETSPNACVRGSSGSSYTTGHHLIYVHPVFQLVSLPEAKLLLKEDDELIKEVFDYWSRKRKNSKANSLIPTVKQEKRDGSSTNDPYVAFRRRTEKMQTRKVRGCLGFDIIIIIITIPT